MANSYYMACLDLRGRRCLVVGGGCVGLEKARGLIAAGASVTVLAPEHEAELCELPVALVERGFEDGDAAGFWLVIAATPDREVNRRVHAECETLKIFCNVADDPELCSFILPAVHRQGPLAVAVSTGGASPALAKRLRDEIARVVRPEHADLAVRLRALRPWAKQEFETYGERRDYFDALVAKELA
jgi:siroheme synthase-like protein